MKLVRGVAVGSLLVMLAGCAGNKAASSGPGPDYVEVDNPMITMDPNATPTIWVPRRYVDSGPPRGTELVKKGYEKVTTTPEQQAAMAAAAQQQAARPAPPPPPLKSRISLLETGNNGLLLPFSEKMRNSGAGVILDPAQSSTLTKFSTITNQAERGKFAIRLQQEYGTTITVFVAAPDGLAPGKELLAEIYDGLGGELVRTTSTQIPQYASTEATARESAVSKALLELTAKVKEVTVILPWYGKVAAVEGNRAYINAGKEANLRTGQKLKIYRGGKVVSGLGFAPGEQVGTLEVSGYVGPNGAFCAIKEGQGVQPSDLVSVD